MKHGQQSRTAVLSAIACGLAAILAACAPEGRAPQSATVGEETFTVWRLQSLLDASQELHIAQDEGLVFDHGRAERLGDCSRRGYVCVEYPFIFAVPDDGTVPERPWQVGDFEFRSLGVQTRAFCGREREVYLIEGSNGAGWATRTWYHPDFGVYAVTAGLADGTRVETVEQAWQTCDRGLFAANRET